MNGIRFRLNGKETCYDGSAADRLLDVLRDEYDMKSVKCGCKEGECGACAVLIDGVLINSCCVAMGAVDSHEILTVEGYRETARFEALSKAFADLSAVQCGFCIPGMILAAEALLSKNAHPRIQNCLRSAGVALRYASFSAHVLGFWETDSFHA